MVNRQLPLRGQLYPSQKLHLVWPSGSNSERKTTLCPSFSLFHVPAAPTPHLSSPILAPEGWAGQEAWGRGFLRQLTLFVFLAQRSSHPSRSRSSKLALPWSLCWVLCTAPSPSVGCAPQPSWSPWFCSPPPVPSLTASFRPLRQPKLSSPGFSIPWVQCLLASRKASEQPTPLLASIPLPCYHGSPSARAALFISHTLQTPGGTLSSQELSHFCLLHVYQAVLFFFFFLKVLGTEHN